MLSIYIHIPFCNSKCKYCSFNSFSVNKFQKILIDNYVKSLCNEITKYGKRFHSQKIKSIYFGGGTPSKIGLKNIIKIYDTIKKNFNLTNLSEFSIELNPFPFDEIITFISILNKQFKSLPRLRYSFGVQSFNNEILSQVGRPYNFQSIQKFFESLEKIKQSNNVFNFDFIAFGKFNSNNKLWDQNKLNFFKKFLISKIPDSISLYTLEISSQMKNYDFYGDDDQIFDEFEILKNAILNSGYDRYEISNFTKPGKGSIQNQVYRNMENYIGFGISASSFIKKTLISNIQKIKTFKPFLTKNTEGIRRTNTADINQYIKGNYLDSNQINFLSKEDSLVEEFFLRLRTAKGIQNIDKFKSILVRNYQSLITNYKKSGLVNYNKKTLTLKDKGMNIYNLIITDLLDTI